jgi:hypothetical protein
VIRGFFSSKTHPLLAPLVPQLKDLLTEYAVAGFDALLGKVVALPEGAPFATSKDVLARFRLTDDAHELRAVFEGGGRALGALYLGSGQGVRQVNARRGDQDAVYQIDLASYAVQATPGNWIDKAVLQVPKEEIAAIEVDGLKLERSQAGGGCEGGRRPAAGGTGAGRLASRRGQRAAAGEARGGRRARGAGGRAPGR